MPKRMFDLLRPLAYTRPPRRRGAEPGSAPRGAPVAPLTPERLLASPARLASAYRQVEGEMRALPLDTLVPGAPDIMAVAARALGVLPRLATLRASMERLPELDLRSIDALESYACALAQAHAHYAMSRAAEHALPALVERASKLRRLMAAEAVTFALHGWVDGVDAHRFHWGRGPQGLADDLAQASEFFRSQPVAGLDLPRLGPDCLDEADALSKSLLAALHVRQQGPGTPEQALLMCRRALTLVVRAYGEARRAVTYLRWRQGDADRLLPSLTSERRSRRRRKASRARTLMGQVFVPHVVPSAPLYDGGSEPEA